MKITQLRCEYLNYPLGIDVHRPRLSWQLESDQPGAKQTAYQIVVEAQIPGQPANNFEVLWDSGKVVSDQSVHVEYGGPTLVSRQRLHWRVRVWDEHNRTTRYSRTAWWEMGLLNKKDWQSRWIGSLNVGGPRTTSPCPYLRKPFQIYKSVAWARLYITALGVYEACLNGQRIGDAQLVPGWTNFNRRTRYQVYDVANMLLQGDNALGVILGDGWYCGNLEWRGRQLYGDRPKLIAQLEIIFTDGSQQKIISDKTWHTATGPLLESDLIMGESYDARLELPGWDQPGYNEKHSKSHWLPVEVFPEQQISLVAQNGPVIHCVEVLHPIGIKELKTWPNSTYVFDLGQNMVGRVKLQVSGKAGSTIRLRYAEVTNPDGSIYTANLRTARQTDYYTLKGNGIEVYEPRFTFHGFRYVEVTGFTGAVSKDMLTGIVLHSDMAVTGSFDCSDPLVNQLQHNILWGQKGNFLDVPTDCPQRDERLGWTGDAQVFSRTAAFNMDVASFFTKWLQDLEDSQGENGAIPPISPNTFIISNSDGGPAWADAVVICPWNIYLYFGDRRLVEEHYDMMKRFVEYLFKTSPGYIRVNQVVDVWTGVDEWLWGGFGDWLALDGSGRTDGGTPKDLIGTAFFAYSAKLLSQIASALKKPEEAQYYAELFQKVREAFIKRFVTPDGLISGGTQTSFVLALHFDLLPSEVRQRAAIALVRDIKKHEMHLTTGFVGTSYLPFVLSEVGRTDIAYGLLFQKSWPSWLYAITQGATTIWERWDGWTHDKGFQDPGMNSFNHYAYGAIGSWLYSVVAGINADPVQPGYKHILFRPQPGEALTYAKATLQSMYGLISSSWRYEGENFVYDIVVPANTTATVYLPGETDGMIVESGHHHFEQKGNKHQ